MRRLYAGARKEALRHLNGIANGDRAWFPLLLFWSHPWWAPSTIPLLAYASGNSSYAFPELGSLTQMGSVTLPQLPGQSHQRYHR